MCAKLFLLLGALAALASAVPRPDNPPVYGAPPPTYKQPGMPFDFAYAVRDDYSGNDYAHQQTSDGHVTSGSYHVVLPDGRTEVVSFEADHDNGYVANVVYEGEARYPTHQKRTGGSERQDFLKLKSSSNSHGSRKANQVCQRAI
ncbi:cuticle protein 21-like [Penaeus japonicus]|uniref:cuticle protein 21-like n=1 Tax=Penaeus japonicus TaxID=27405 RepID=UPI001C712944|nr:cuticle protein 21-like [Penaeus japonicus]